MSWVIGIGCDRNTAQESIAEAVGRVLQEQGIDQSQVQCLATIDIKGDEQGLLAFAQAQNWPLQLFPAAALAKVQVPNPSEVVRRYTGTPAVAEAAALLAAQTTQENLLVEKYKHRDAAGRNVTVSLAKVDDDAKG